MFCSFSELYIHTFVIPKNEKQVKYTYLGKKNIAEVAM